jgi:hypothetical protein
MRQKDRCLLIQDSAQESQGLTGLTMGLARRTNRLLADGASDDQMARQTPDRSSDALKWTLVTISGQPFPHT